MNCHICDSETDFNCEQCEEPVCEECCVIPTYLNQIDYALCTECGDQNDAERWAEANREDEQEKRIKAKKKKRNATRKANYWKPENVEKRRLAKIERERLRIEWNKKMIEETFKIVGSIFQ